MRRSAEPNMTRLSNSANDWSQIGTRILDAARVATALHLAKAAQRTGRRDVAEESPRGRLGG